jgi:hypothetical protein
VAVRKQDRIEEASIKFDQPCKAIVPRLPLPNHEVSAQPELRVTNTTDFTLFFLKTMLTPMDFLISHSL